MRVAVVDQKGPKVEGYFALATEILDNSGAPHTLEHLIFMGSKNYQYKGLLDRLSSRAFSYTNAWTAVDHTAYVLKSAGWEGFSLILPAYLEHLIVPTLTDAACYTEVHHIDGTGHDAGVVYSEMQGAENVVSDMMERRARELLYPEGSGFRSETGGLMRELRSLTADRIRAFHKEMYQPKNLRVVLTGEIDHDELLQILDEFETTIMPDVPPLDAPFKRPWVESKPTTPLKETVIETIQFPEEDESVGEILVSYLGPDGNDSLATSALSILLIYLCGSSISVLENTLVEREQLCSAIYFSTETRPDIAIQFWLTSVETERLNEVYLRLIDLLKETANKPLNVPYMHDCIRRLRRQIKQKSENADDFFTTPIIEDHLFGHRDGRHLKDLATLCDLDSLETWPEKQWIDFLTKWLSDAKHVAVLGIPSAELSEKISNDEKARVKAQQERLGDSGLKHLADKLEKAQEENNRPIPDSLLGRWPVPSPDSVHFIATVTARSGAARKMGRLENDIQRIVDKADDGSPLFIHFEHIPSNFVHIRLYMGTAVVPPKLKPLLSLYLANLFTTPMRMNGKRVEFEDLVLELEQETVYYGVDTASGNQEMIAIKFEVEPEAYERIISRLRTILFDAVHDPDRLYASLTKMLAEIPEYKRDGESMVFAINHMLAYNQSGNWHAMSSLTKAVYLKRLRKLLKTDEQAVISDLTNVCNALHRPENFRVFVAADMNKIPKPVSAWKTLTNDLDLSKPLEPLDSCKATLSDLGKQPGSTAYVVPLSAIDSSFAFLTSRAPDSYAHPDLPALIVATSFLSTTEGPLWVAVRGEGLAYGTHFMRSTSVGLLTFMIHKSPDPYKAYVASKEQVEGYAYGRLDIDKFAMESAISEIVYSMASDQPTMSAAADDSFVNQVMIGVDKNYNQQLLSKVGGIKPDHVRQAMTKYLVPLFNPQTANLIVTCARIMAEPAVANFTRAGFQPLEKHLEFFQDDYGFQAPAGEDEPDEDEDEDEDDDDEDGETDDDASNEHDG